MKSRLVTITRAAVLAAGNGAADVDAVRSFAASNAEVTSQLNAYNYADATNLYLFVSQSAGNAEVAADLLYSVVPNDNTLGDFQNTAAIPEINIQMRSMALVAKTRKLKAVWTPEFAQDLNAYQALDAEAEVTNILSEYISLEIDSEILAMLIQDAAAGTEYWSANGNEFYVSGDDFTQKGAGNGGFYNTQGQWFQTLGTKVNKLSNEIHRLTLRGGANFMVVSPTVSTILESIPGFAADNSDAEKMEYAFGIQKAGQLNGRYKVYKNPIHDRKHYLVRLQRYSVLGSWCGIRSIHSINHDSFGIRSRYIRTKKRSIDSLREENAKTRILR